MPPSKNGKEPQRDNFTMIPNILDTMELTPYDFRLYFHIKMVIGEESPDFDQEYLSRGVCRKSIRALAKACRMSIPEITYTKRHLIAEGLISVEPHPKGSRSPQGIRIIKVWRKNHAMFHQVPLPEAPPSDHQVARTDHQVARTDPPPITRLHGQITRLHGGLSEPDTPKKGKKSTKNWKEDGASAETASASPPLVPEEFQAISQLVGYKPGDHSKAFSNISQACADAGVKVQDVVAHFVPYYSAQRHRNGWKDPVRDLDRTVHIEIGKALRGATGPPGNGRYNSRPRRVEAHRDPKDFAGGFWGDGNGQRDGRPGDSSAESSEAEPGKAPKGPGVAPQV